MVDYLARLEVLITRSNVKKKKLDEVDVINRIMTLKQKISEGIIVPTE